jgi:PleD family two-component response regulator
MLDRPAHGAAGRGRGGDLGGLTEATADTAYRLVQEPLTNALKHAPGAPIHITLSGQAVTASADNISVLVVDDQRLIRAGFQVIFDLEPDITVVGEAGDGHEAIMLAARLRPTVVLMDVRMPGMDGLAAARVIVVPDLPRP